jgi:hypothetical protein
MKLTKIGSIRLYGNSEYTAERARASLVHADARSYAHVEAGMKWAHPDNEERRRVYAGAWYHRKRRYAGVRFNNEVRRTRRMRHNSLPI